MTRFALIAWAAGVAIGAVGCAGRPGVAWRGSASSPDPTGCYVLVFDEPQFVGAREYINGPRSYATLVDLPYRVNWRHRIQSAAVGQRATVMLWTDVDFRGTSQRLAPGTEHRTMPNGLAGRIESVEVTCTQQ